MNIMIIAAHPDDEVLGAGGTIAKYVKQGHKVYRCLMTKAWEPLYAAKQISEKRQEAEEAGKALKIEKTYFLDYPTLKLDTVPMFELQQKIIDCAGDCSPDTVLIPHRGDIHNDHKVAFEASFVLSKLTKESTVNRILSYEVICSSNWAAPFADSAFVPNLFEDISQTLDEKMKALRCYRSEMKPHPHLRSLETIEISAKKWGSVIGCGAAEPFILLRERAK